MIRWIAVLAALAIAGYGAFRVVRHFAFPARGPSVICDQPPTFIVGPHPIISFGDSITWGYDATHNCVALSAVRKLAPKLHRPGPDDTTYPADLARLMGRPVLDYGVPGETTAGGLRRLPAVLRATHPRAVVLQEGINDLTAGASPVGVAARIERMVRAVQPARVVLVTLLPANLHGFRVAVSHPPVQRVNRLIRSVRVTCLVDAWAYFHGKRGLLEPDGLHPTDQGYRVLAHAIVRSCAGF